MELLSDKAEWFLPGGGDVAEALGRTTHLGVAAHPDDLEIMALHGILACRSHPERHFTGVVLTDGSSGPRTTHTAGLSDEQMGQLRRREQKEAAQVGDYNALLLLGQTSSALKRASRESALVTDLITVLRQTRPEVVYTHSLTDRHDTHLATCLRTLDALRVLPRDIRPRQVLGCEVWGDLDWMGADGLVTLDLSGGEALGAALLRVFRSQIEGGKRYDLAVAARRQAHATFRSTTSLDTATSLALAMELTPLVEDSTRKPRELAAQYLARFAREVDERLSRFSGE